MNVLLVCESYLPDFGGVQSLVRNLAKQLVLSGNRVTIAAGNLIQDGEPLAVYELIDDIEVYRFNFIPLWGFDANSVKNFIFIGWKNMLRFMGLIRKINPDVINAHFIGGSAFYTLLPKLILGHPLVSTIHGSDIRVFPGKLWFHGKLIPAALKHSDAITSSSKDLSKYLAKILPNQKLNCVPIPNGINLEIFDNAEPYEHEAPYIFSMGRFFEEKGFDVLLRSFKGVTDKFPEVQLLIAGDGPQKLKLERLVESTSLKGKVKFLGVKNREDIASFLKGCEFFVLPSRRESFPVSILECMAAGKTIITTNVGGIPEIVVNNQNGLIVEAENEKALADAMAQLLKDKAFRKRLECNSANTVREYDINKVCEKYLMVYKSIMHQERKK